MHRSLFRSLLSLSLLWVAVAVSAQTNENRPVRVSSDLRQIMRQAGMIFAGRVVSIQPVRLAGSDQIVSVRVSVQVEQGVREARTGERLSFSEWAGLWSTGERYRVGQRLMLFLYPRSTIGLTSPVGGSAGRMVIDKSGQVLLTAEQQDAIRITRAPVRSGVSRMIPVRDFARALRRMGEE